LSFSKTKILPTEGTEEVEMKEMEVVTETTAAEMVVRKTGKEVVRAEKVEVKMVEMVLVKVGKVVTQEMEEVRETVHHHQVIVEVLERVIRGERVVLKVQEDHRKFRGLTSGKDTTYYD
jgi:hypothetical protein